MLRAAAEYEKSGPQSGVLFQDQDFDNSWPHATVAHTVSCGDGTRRGLLSGRGWRNYGAIGYRSLSIDSFDEVTRFLL